MIRFSKALLVVGRPSQITFSVNRSGEMVVEIAALRHLAQKRFERDRLSTKRGKLACRRGFCRVAGSTDLRTRRNGKDDGCESRAYSHQLPNPGA